MPKKNEADPSQRGQYRSNMLTFNTLLELLNNNGLTESHVKLLKKTPFWNLIDPYMKGLVSDKYYQKYDENIVEIIKCFDINRCKFRFGNRYADFTPRQVSQILGIPNRGKRIELHKRNVPTETFIDKYFNTKKQCTKPLVETALIAALGGEDSESVSDVVRLIVLHFCLSFFFPKSGNTLGWSFASYIHNISMIKSYNWALAIHDWLVESMRKKIPDNSPSTVTGCVPVLLFWLCEISSIMPPIKGRETQRPRFLRWDLQSLKRKFPEITLSKIELNSVTAPKQKKVADKMKQVASSSVGDHLDDAYVVSVRFTAKAPHMHGTDLCPDTSIPLSASPTPQKNNATPLDRLEFGNHLHVEGEKLGAPSQSHKETGMSLTQMFEDGLPETCTFEREMNEVKMQEYAIARTPMGTHNYIKALETKTEEPKSKVRQHELCAQDLRTIINSDKLTIIALQDKIADLVTRKSTLEVELKKETKDSIALRSEIKNITNERNTLLQEIVRVGEANSNLQVYATAQEDGVKKITRKLTHVGMQLNTGKDQVDSVLAVKDEVIDLLRKSKRKMEEDIQLLKTEFSKVDSVLAMKEEEISQLRKSETKMEEDMQLLKTEFSSMMARQTEHEVVIDQQHKQIETHKVKISCVEAENQKLATHNISLCRMVQKLGGVPECLESECPDLRIVRVKERTRSKKHNPEYDWLIQKKGTKRTDDLTATFVELQPAPKRSKLECKGPMKNSTKQGVSRVNVAGTSNISRVTKKDKSLIKSTLFHLLNEEAQRKLKAYCEKATVEEPVWQLEHDCVSRKNLCDLLYNQPTTNHVIDAYTTMLKIKLGSTTTRKKIFLSTLAWDFVRMNSEASIQSFVYDVILGNLSRSEQIFIPMWHHKEFHFTLLYLDKELRMWLHCNPLRKRRVDALDNCFDEANQLHTVIQQYVSKMKKYGPKILKEGRKDLVWKGRGNADRKELNEAERETIEWIVNTDAYYPIYQCLEFPHQMEGSLDCGIAIMYYMRELALGHELRKDVNNGETMTKMRVHLADAFLNHQFSWACGENSSKA